MTLIASSRSIAFTNPVPKLPKLVFVSSSVKATSGFRYFISHPSHADTRRFQIFGGAGLGAFARPLLNAGVSALHSLQRTPTPIRRSRRGFQFPPTRNSASPPQMGQCASSHADGLHFRTLLDDLLECNRNVRSSSLTFYVCAASRIARRLSC